MTIPVVATSVALVVCAFNGGVLGTGMLGATAQAAKSRQPDPTIPFPLNGPSSLASSGPTTSMVGSLVGSSAAPVILLPPGPPANIPYIVLSPEGSTQAAPAGPSVPTPLATVAVPSTSAAPVIPSVPAPPATKAVPKSAKTTTTTRPKKVSQPAQTSTTVVAYELETIQALPPATARPTASVAGVVILADASKGTSGAGALTPPTTPTSSSPTLAPTATPSPSSAPSTALAPLPTVPVPLATTQTTFPVSPLPTVLITPVLTRNTPTVPTTAPPTGAATAVTSPTVPVPLDNVGTTGTVGTAPSETGVSTVPTTTKPKVFTFVGRQDYDIVPPVSPLAADAVAWALAQVGQPYLWGGEGIGGFDCSGLSKMAWLSVGVRLTHQSRVQFNETVRLNVADLEPGDLVFYGDPIHHLGIYIGDGKMVEAPRQGVPVRIAAIKRRDLVGAGRIRY